MNEGEEKYLTLPIPRSGKDQFKKEIEKVLTEAIDLKSLSVDEIHVDEIQVWATVSFTVPLNIITVKDEVK